MPSDYVPASDEHYNLWQARFATYCTANKTALGLPDKEVDDILLYRDPWENDYAAHLTAHDAAKTACVLKDNDRTAYTQHLRMLAGRIQANPAVTDEMKEAMGLPIRSEHHKMTLGTPMTHPLVVVKSNQRLFHEIDFRDEATPGSRKRPEWAAGCEVWIKVGGPPPIGSSECVLKGIAAKTPYLIEFPDGDGGKIVHYLLRWVNRHGERGRWSETATATIAA